MPRAGRKAVMVQMPLDEWRAIERARGTTDRSSWIREACRQRIAADTPLMGSTEPSSELAQPRVRSEPRSGSVTRW
jgi:hypothetical protein